VRIADDEAAADAERQRLTHDELPHLPAEPAFSLRENEILHAVRASALLEDRQSAIPQGGTLYLTSQRLIHAGQAPREVRLADIAETGVALERLLLVDLDDGSDLAIEVDQPRLLRVQLAAARAAARERAG
jgi:hypothetical protein